MKFIPKILIVDEIPMWIISSDTAAYHPVSQTIYLRSDQGFLTLVHELGHHLIHLLGGRRRVQNLYDKLCLYFFYRKTKNKHQPQGFGRGKIDAVRLMTKCPCACCEDRDEAIKVNEIPGSAASMAYPIDIRSSCWCNQSPEHERCDCKFCVSVLARTS